MRNGKSIEKAVVNAYRKIEDGAVGTYRKIENSVIGAYGRVENRFEDKFLRRAGETPEDAKARLQKK